MLVVCMRYVKNLADAEELMLTGFYNFYRTIERFVYNGDSSISAWLKKIMVNECLMHLRKRGELIIVEERHAEELVAENSTLERMNANEIFKLVLALPAGYRTVFNLYVVEGYTHKEIAKLLGIAEGTSKSQLNKARAMMQQLIKENMPL